MNRDDFAIQRFIPPYWQKDGLALTIRAICTSTEAGLLLGSMTTLNRPMAIYGGVMADWETRSLFADIETAIWRRPP